MGVKKQRLITTLIVVIQSRSFSHASFYSIQNSNTVMDDTHIPCMHTEIHIRKYFAGQDAV